MADKSEIPKYTQEEIEEYKQVFALFDTDGSGAIGNDELGEAMRSMGMNPSEKELENLIKEVDVDGNGEIDFDEFCMVMKRMSTKKESDEEIIRSCFTVFDQDRNGIVSESEFKYIFKEVGGFPDKQIDEIFREVDIDGNGQIDFDEFAQMVRTYLLEEEEEKPIEENPELLSPTYSAMPVTPGRRSVAQ